MKERFPGQFHKVTNNDLTAVGVLSNTVPLFVKVMYFKNVLRITTSNHLRTHLTFMNKEGNYIEVKPGDYIVQFDEPNASIEGSYAVISKEIMTYQFDISL